MTTPNEELIVRLQNYDWAHDHDCVNDAAIVLQSQAERIKTLGAAYRESLDEVSQRNYELRKENDTLRAELEALRGQEPVAWFAFGDSNGPVPLELYGWDEKACKHAVLTYARAGNWKGTVEGYLMQQGWTLRPVYLATPVAPAQPAQSSVAFSDRVVEIFLAVNGPASSGVMDSLRLAAAHAYSQPAQGERVEVDWQDQYWKQKRRAKMWIAKYEKDIGPLEKAHPVAANPAQDVNAERCCQHDSDCAVHNMPAYPAGSCDCSLQTVAWVSVAKGDVSKALLYFNVNEEIKPLGVVGEATTRAALANAKAARQKATS